jgi:hypothetical protein
VTFGVVALSRLGVRAGVSDRVPLGIVAFGGLGVSLVITWPSVSSPSVASASARLVILCGFNVVVAGGAGVC